MAARPLALVLTLLLAPAVALAAGPGDDPDTWEASAASGSLGWDEAVDDIRWSGADGELGQDDLADWYTWDVRTGDAVIMTFFWFFAPDDGIVEIRGGSGELLASISTDDLLGSAVRREWQGAPVVQLHVGVLSPSGQEDSFQISLAAAPDLDFAVTGARFAPEIDAPGRVLVDVAIPAGSAHVSRALRLEPPEFNVALDSVVVHGSDAGGAATFALDLPAPIHGVRARLAEYSFDGHPENDQRTVSVLG